MFGMTKWSLFKGSLFHPGRPQSRSLARNSWQPTVRDGWLVVGLQNLKRIIAVIACERLGNHLWGGCSWWRPCHWASSSREFLDFFPVVVVVLGCQCWMARFKKKSVPTFWKNPPGIHSWNPWSEGGTWKQWNPRRPFGRLECSLGLSDDLPFVETKELTMVGTAGPLAVLVWILWVLILVKVRPCGLYSDAWKVGEAIYATFPHKLSRCFLLMKLSSSSDGIMSLFIVNCGPFEVPCWPVCSLDAAWTVRPERKVCRQYFGVLIVLIILIRR